MPSDAQKILFLIGSLSFVLALYCQQIILGGVPHVSDETNYILQARTLGSFQRVTEQQELGNLFALPFWFNWTSFSASGFPIGWPLLLSSGMAVGIGNLINPLLCFLLPWLGWQFFTPYFKGDQKGLLLACGLLALSPGVWLLGATWMAHTSCLSALFLLGIGLQNRSWRWAGGAGWAYILLARPFDGVVLCGALFLLYVAKIRSIRWILSLLTLPTLALCIVLYDNWSLTGNPLVFPIDMWFSKFSEQSDKISSTCNQLGFGEDVGCIPTLGTFGHTLSKALALAKMAFMRLDRLLMGTAGMSIILFIGIFWQRKYWRMIVFALWVPIAYLPYWSLGEAYGARFWHPMYLAIPIFIAVALARLPKFWPWVIFLGSISIGTIQMRKSLSQSYFCSDSMVPNKIAQIEEGFIFLDIRGSYEQQWRWLYSPTKSCTPGTSIAAIYAMQTDKRHIRIWPKKQSAQQKYMQMIAEHPKYLLRYDLASQKLAILPITKQ